MEKKTPIKIEMDGMIYYTYLEWMSNMIHPSTMILMQLSHFVINTKTNEIIKCRHSIEDVIDLVWAKYNETN